VPYTLPHCTCACGLRSSRVTALVPPPYWDKFSHRFTPPHWHPILYTTISRGAKGPSIPHRLVVPSICEPISLSFPSESHRRANFTPYSQCGLPASSMASRTTRFFQIYASTRLASSVCRLAPGCAKCLTSSAYTVSSSNSSIAPASRSVPKTCLCLYALSTWGILTDRFLARPNFPRAPNLL